MMAWAAETAAETGVHAAAAAAHAAEHAAPEPWYMGAEFWVFVAFVIFVVVVGRIAYRVVTVALDDRADRIKAQIEEAQRLQAEAQELLASYERKQREAAQEAESIIELARREADAIAEQASADLERSLKRREQLAMDRIAQAEAVAVSELKARAVDIAMTATRTLLAENTTGKQAEALINAAIEELPEKLKAH